MSQKLIALQNRKIAIFNRLLELREERMKIDSMLNQIEIESETPIFDIFLK